MGENALVRGMNGKLPVGELGGSLLYRGLGGTYSRWKGKEAGRNLGKLGVGRDCGELEEEITLMLVQNMKSISVE